MLESSTGFQSLTVAELSQPPGSVQYLPNQNSFAASSQISPVPCTPSVTGDSLLSEARLLEGIQVMVRHWGSDDSPAGFSCSRFAPCPAGVSTMFLAESPGPGAGEAFIC